MASDPRAERVLRRLRVLAVCAGLLALCCSAAPGLVGSDTKLDLTADPGQFLVRALHLWDADGQLGRVQNQAYGYLFPTGPFFVLVDVLEVPAWLGQRLWMGLLLAVAYTGVFVLGRRLGVRSEVALHLAGLAYALSPRALTLLGSVSVEWLCSAVLPWVIIPLVRALRGGSARRGAALSGLAVLAMGGVNATAAVAALTLPGLLLLLQLRTPRGRRLLAWWVPAVALATVWWLGPLVLLSTVAPPFLQFTETAAVTTATTAPDRVLRGVSHWVGYLGVDGRAVWPAGHALSTQAVPAVATLVLALLGLVGLAVWPRGGRTGPSWRTWLVLSVVAGVALIGLGHGTHAPWADSVRVALDGPLAPLRNLHKLDALVRLPLCLGVASAVATAWAAGARRTSARRSHGPGRGAAAAVPRSATAAGVVVVAVASLAGTVLPAAAAGLVPAGAYPQLAPHWREAAGWLDETAGPGSVLVVPGSPTADLDWGSPNDEPVQALLSRPWAVRTQVVEGSVGLARLLDRVGLELRAGQPSPHLSGVLARSGIRYVVVRADLRDPDEVAATTATLRTSPGIRPGPRFGTTRPVPVTERPASAVEVPALQVYEVDGAAPPVAVEPASSAVVLTGGPESLAGPAAELLPDADAPAVDAATPGGAAVVAALAEAGDEAPSVVTDTFRRRETTFSRLHDNTSATLTATESPRQENVAVDLAPEGAPRTTATWFGVRDVMVSSSAGDADVDLLRAPASGAWAAVDGRPDTLWLSNPLQAPVGQWIEVRLGQAQDLDGATIAVAGGSVVRRATEVRVETDTGTTDQVLDASPTTLDLPPGPTTRLRVTVLAVDQPAAGGGMVGVTALDLPGVGAERSLRVPDPPVDGPVSWAFEREPSRQPCLDLADGDPARCAPASAERGEDDVPRLDRTFASSGTQRVGVRGTARLVGWPDLESWWAPAGVVVDATSRWVPDPSVSAAAALDQDPLTAWRPAPSDLAPALVAAYAEPRPVDRVDLRLAPGPVPRDVAVTREGRTEVVPLPADGVVRLDPVLTQVVRVELRALAPDASGLPVGVVELDVPAFDDLLLPRTGSERVLLECGRGPVLTLDGRTFPSRVDTTVETLRSGGAIAWEACTGAAVTLRTGVHRLVADDALGLTVTSVLVEPDGKGSAPRGDRTEDGLRGSGTRWTLDVAGGDAAVVSMTTSANPGWTASAGGTPLEPVTLDGWRQGFVLPQGEAAEVVVEYAPDRTYRALLVVGAASAGLLVLGAAVPGRRRRPVVVAPPARGGAGLAVASLVGAVAVLGPWGVAAWAAGLAAGRALPLAGLPTAVTAPLGAGLVWLLLARTASDLPVEDPRFLVDLAAVAVVAAVACLPAAGRRQGVRAGAAG